MQRLSKVLMYTNLSFNAPNVTETKHSNYNNIIIKLINCLKMELWHQERCCCCFVKNLVYLHILFANWLTVIGLRLTKMEIWNWWNCEGKFFSKSIYYIHNIHGYFHKSIFVKANIFFSKFNLNIISFLFNSFV